MDKVLHALFACHRLPERSFFHRGKQFPICARCTGILAGYLLGLIYAIVVGAIPLLIAGLLLLPLIVDGGLQYIGKWHSTNTRRFITGILAGVAVDFLIWGIVTAGFSHGKLIVQHLIE
ncbi:putative membrane protein [Bacillus ectoiniformans]|uniref:DUF2085 domain-containing protein n=1 Tax=Bacillus ectoiniformans TaxID=1494429 RepID=UPI00195EEC31|nr:DUF2085 domain-containing protein [Bacillus ectoiniformans]MBM7649905.1 putative membrane protein [Bacillus ectoiniformans]